MMDRPVLVIFIITLVTLGILTNVSFLIVVARIRYLRRNSINSYLVSMAAADLFFLITNKFFLQVLSQFSEELVLVAYAINTIPEIVTELMMPLVAYDWYKAICLPTKTFATRCDNKSATAYVLISWLVSGEMTRLKEQPEIIRNSVLARNQIIKMLIANTVAFFLLLSPSKVNVLYRFAVTLLRPDATFQEHDVVIWWIASEMTLLLNSAINPIVYTAGSDQYRRAFCQTFPCCFRHCTCIDLSTSLDETTREDARCTSGMTSKGDISSSQSKRKLQLQLEVSRDLDATEGETSDSIVKVEETLRC
ncbi:uncharacterized protein [Apostichopus japonicus]|uniref:uncharacterized protein n=1 Tax=Stichopus japonicus TaxID=307972 RepID=UPI003AB4BAE0